MSTTPRIQGPKTTKRLDLELSIKFPGPVWKSRLRATAQLTKRRRTFGLLECDVTDEKGSLVARAHSPCVVLRGESAKGR